MRLSEVSNSITPNTYKPSETERTVIAIVVVTETPQLAAAQIEHDDNRMYAANKLVDVGFLTGDEGYTLTSTGEDLAKSQALMDETGSPTESATELAASISDGI